MSREIPQDRIDSGDLDEDEILYLQDRGLLPEHVEPLKLCYADGGGVEGAEYADEEEEADEDEDEEEEVPDTPKTEKSGDPEYRLAADDEEYEDYDEGWTNDTRRAELTTRNLSIEGKKQELIARLLRSDADELIDEDQPSEDDTDEED